MSKLFIISSILLLSYIGTKAKEGSKKFEKAKLVSSKFAMKLTSNSTNNIILLNNVTFQGSSKKYKLLLDSGSKYTSISKDLAKEIGFTPLVESTITDGYVEENISLGLLDICIDGICFKNVGTTVMKPSVIEDIYNIDGIIGYNLMRTCIWQLSQGNVFFTDDIKEIDSLSIYYKQKIYNGPFLVGGFVNGYNATMLFDLGDSGELEIQESLIKYIKEKEIAVGRGRAFYTAFGEGNYTDTTINKLLKVPGFKFGNDTIKNMIVTTTTHQFSPIDAIGAGILKFYDLVLDFPKMKWYSKNILDEYPVVKIFGFDYDVKEGKVFIKFLWDNSPALMAGLKIGDEIEKINDTDIKNIARNELSEFMREARNKQTMTIKVKGIDDIIILEKELLFKN